MPGQQEQRSQATGPLEIRIGGREAIRVTALREIVEEQSIPYRRTAEMHDLPLQAVEEASAGIAALPFYFGNNEYIGTFPHPSLDVEMVLSPRMLTHDVPESEKAKVLLALRFNSGASQTPLSVHPTDGARIEHGSTGEVKQATIVRFAPEKPLYIAGKEVGEVCLVLPIETP